jgi:hypothetical protein
MLTLHFIYVSKIKIDYFLRILLVSVYLLSKLQTFHHLSPVMVQDLALQADASQLQVI